MTRRLLHRHHGVHRLQGLRGRVQAVEPVARRRVVLHRHVVRQHRAARRVDLASCRLHRTARTIERRRKFSWLLMSDVCKHCQRAGCLEPARPARSSAPSSTPSSCSRTSATAAATACRLPVRRHRPARGRRPRLEVHALLRPPRRGHEPACAKACPTESIQFGDLDELREQRRRRECASCTTPASPTRTCTARAPPSSRAPTA